MRGNGKIFFAKKLLNLLFVWKKTFLIVIFIPLECVTQTDK